MKPYTVYLLCFTQPVGPAHHRASHYIGLTVNLDNRMREHRSGQGAALCRALRQQGGDFVVVRTWEAKGNQEAYALERRLKRWRNHSHLCPACKSSKSRRKATCPTTISAS
jgi:predicted GIY-YIG superfamily endonuclease